MKLYGDGKHGVLPSALGTASSGMALVVLGMLTYYLTTQTGLSGTVVGTILLASRIFDGVSDLIAGFIIDRSHFKLGKARPFDLFSVPMWIALVLCFAVPEWNTAGKVIYVFLMYNLCQTVCYTFYSVASTVRLKRTFVEEKRATTISIAAVLTAVLATAAGIIMPLLIDKLEYQPGGWIIITGVFAVPGILMSLSMFFFAPEMQYADAGTEEEQTSFRDFAKALFQNKYLVMIIIIVMAGTMASAMVGGTGTFYYKYVYGDLTSQSLVGVVGLVGYFFMLFLPVLTKKFGNRVSMMIAFGFVSVGNIAKYIAPTSLPWLAICTVIALVGTASAASISSLVLIDTINYGRLKTGKENDGVYSSIKGFSDKIANGIAPFLIGVLLDAGGFDGTLEVQTAAANNMVLALFALVPAVIGVIGFVTMLFCKMEKEIREMEAAEKARSAE